MTDIITATSDGVLSITFNRPEKKNALTGAMYEAIIAAMNEAEKDARIGAVTLAGAGGTFTAGNDIADFVAGAQRTDTFPALRFIRRIAMFEKPIVAAVDGLAVGVGTTMLLHCDLIYAAPDTIFRLPFVDLGLVPEAASSLLLPARIGLPKASELLMLADPFDAREAERLGLINAVVPHDLLLARAHERAKELAAKPRNALMATRRLLRGDRQLVLERIDREALLFMAALKSKEANEAFTAFMGRKT